ncbi:MAG: YbaK/EbsC family protein [Candidatus Curtissbacteria bacterium]|nr:YbaK/EbsC family protein [Candidatus Curtissbacteria bacterium]
MANLEEIEKHLKKIGVDYKIIDLGGEVYRVQDVIRVGINADEIVKTLVIRSEVKRGLEFKTEFNALAVRGKDRLDFKKVRRIFGQKTDLAKADEVQRVVGVPIGAVCPIQIGVPLYFDNKVLDLVNVNLGSGDLTKGLDMSLADLLKAVGDFKTSDLT